MKSRAAAVALALVVSALTLAAPGDVAKATHANGYLMGGLHPNPGSATYSTCTTDLGIHLLWAWGPESWEDATDATMNLVYVEAAGGGCTDQAGEQMQFEGYYACPVGAPACHKVYSGDAYSHSTPPMGTHAHLLRGKIVFDVAWWKLQYKDPEHKKHKAAPAHEMGHGLGLGDHAEPQCTANTIMGQLVQNEDPCYQAPTFWDAIAAMGYHGYFG